MSNDRSNLTVFWKDPRGCSGEDLLARDLADRRDSGVLDLALDRDRVEALADGLGPADPMQGVALPELFLDHVGCSQHTITLLPQHERECEVIELCDDLGSDVVGLEPFVERPPECRAVARKQDGNTVERVRKSV